MMSKRELYQPAVVSSKNFKERVPLAQGRLLKDPNEMEEKDLLVPLPMSSIMTETTDSSNTIRSRRELGALARQRQDDPTISPRRDQPQLSFHDSPRCVKPSQLLDVSDTDSDISKMSLTNPREVLVVNASRASAPVTESSEVAVEMAFTHSPARVICHTASRIRDLSIRVSRDGEVRPLPVTEAQLLEEGDSEETTSPVTHPQEEMSQEVVTRAPDVVTSSGAAPMLHETLKTTRSKHAGASKSDPHGAISRQKLFKEDESSVLENSNFNTTSMSTTGLKKKKAPRFVASRYMAGDGSKAVKGPLKATERSVMGRSSSTSQRGPSSSTTRKVASRHNSSNSSAAAISQPRLQPVSTAVRSSRSATTFTEKKKKEAKKPVGREERKSSTPTLESASGLLTSDSSVDVSAIGISPSLRVGQASHLYNTPPLNATAISVTNESRHKATPRGHKKKTGGDLTSSQDMSSSLKPKKVEPHVSQEQLDMLYTEHIHWVYLEAMTKQAHKEQEKRFLTEMQSLNEENERLRIKRDKLEADVINLKHVNHLNDTLRVQKSGLSKISSQLPQYKNQYHTLAQAIDTTQHQIPTSGIHIPNNQDLFLSELEGALGESEQLLGDLSVLSRQQLPDVEKCSDSLSSMLDSVEAEEEELHRCGEMLAAAKSLSDHEASLQIQHMYATE